MTRFLDGPAIGQTLMLKRTVVFLRVTAQILPESGKVKNWDALDQWEDTPNPDERLYAYKLVRNVGTAHVNMGRGRGGFYPINEYSFVEHQPSQEVMRDNDKWTFWVQSQAQ